MGLTEASSSSLETDEMSFADIEKNISDLGQKARDGKITIEDLGGHLQLPMEVSMVQCCQPRS